MFRGFWLWFLVGVNVFKVNSYHFQDALHILVKLFAKRMMQIV